MTFLPLLPQDPPQKKTKGFQNLGLGIEKQEKNQLAFVGESFFFFFWKEKKSEQVEISVLVFLLLRKEKKTTAFCRNGVCAKLEGCVPWLKRNSDMEERKKKRPPQKKKKKNTKENKRTRKKKKPQREKEEREMYEYDWVSLFPMRFIVVFVSHLFLPTYH